MGTQKHILNEVAKLLQKDNSAYFVCGCLFVGCNEKEARSIFHLLSKKFGVGKVQINGPMQGEYAYDIM